MRTRKPASANDSWLIEELESALRRNPPNSEWYNVLGFSQNPFSEELSLQDSRCWLERRKVVSKIIQQVGASKKRVAIQPTTGGNLSHFLVIGPRYVGRTALSQWLTRELNNKLLPALTITIKAFTFTWNQKINEISHSEESVTNTVEDQRKWIQWLTDLERIIQEESISSKNLVIFFLDDILTFLRTRTPNLSELTEEVRDLHPLFIGFLSWGEYQYALNQSSHPLFQEFFAWFGKNIVFLPPFQQNEIFSLLERRIAIEEDTDLFQVPALKRIGWYSMGLPGLALELGTQVLMIAADSNLDKITKTDVDSIASRIGYRVARDRLDYGIKALQGRVAKCSFLIGRRKDLLLEFLYNSSVLKEQKRNEFGLTGKDLRNSLDLSFSTVSYHLNQLVQNPTNPLGVLSSYQHPHDGRSTIYFLEKPMTSAMELLLGSRNLLTVKTQGAARYLPRSEGKNLPGQGDKVQPTNNARGWMSDE
ncbi:MAG: hypothetical protein ACXADX_08330 [Candidatus Hodarchaeales archaeon]